jgi:phage terminase large subunit GpA-like protein
MTNLNHQVVAFAGPSRCGKSFLGENFTVHAVVADPGDMAHYHGNESKSLKWSKKELQNIFDLCPDVNELILPGRENKTFSDVRFVNGMHIYSLPVTIQNLSQMTLRYALLNDLDQMPQDIASRGTPFELARKRTLIAGRRGLTFAESSPGLPMTDLSWVEPAQAVDTKGNALPFPSHIAPPCGGILDVYNQGDRRRWYWPCVQCGEFFNTRFRDLRCVDSNDDNEVIESAHVICPACQHPTYHVDKPRMNAGGVWLREGQGITAKGERFGNPRRSVIASFHLFGPAAAFIGWGQLCLEYLAARRNYEATLDDEKLKSFANTGAGEVYIAPKPQGLRLAEDIASHAYQGVRLGLATGGEVPVLPEDSRFLVATVDPGVNKFDVQVHAVCLPSMAPDENGRQIPPQPRIRVFDRFRIELSDRLDETAEVVEGIPIHNRLPIKPAVYEEDWRTLIDNVLLRTYPLPDGRVMAVKTMGFDIGGNEANTTNSYQFFRWVRSKLPDLVNRIQPCRGERRENAPRTEIRHPESTKKHQMNAALGDIPVLFDNANRMKDEIDGLINRGMAGDDGVTFAHYLPKQFAGYFQEIVGEYKDPNGKWLPVSKRQRVESWDLLRMCWALVTSTERVGIRLNRIGGFPWDDPPNWAAKWDVNELVSDPRVLQKQQPISSRSASDINWESLGS